LSHWTIQKEMRAKRHSGEPPAQQQRQQQLQQQQLEAAAAYVTKHWTQALFYSSLQAFDVPLPPVN